MPCKFGAKSRCQLWFLLIVNVVCGKHGGMRLNTLKRVFSHVKAFFY